MRCLLLSTACLAAALTVSAQEGTELSMEAAIARLVSYGILPKTPQAKQDDTGEILQHFAKARNGDEEMTEFPYCVRLIRAGGCNNKLPVSCLRPFVKAGADIQGRGGDTSPLQAAAAAGNVKVLRYLLEAGADVHYPDAELRTALDYALSAELRPEHYEVVRMLLHYSAWPTQNAMLFAVQNNCDLLQELLEYGGAISPEVLNAAVWNPEAMELLLRRGACLQCREESGMNVTRALLLRISTGKWTVAEITRLTDLLEQYHAPFYTRMPQEELLLFLPPELPEALRARLLRLYTTMPPPSFPETDATDVEEVEEAMECRVQSVKDAFKNAANRRLA